MKIIGHRGAKGLAPENTIASLLAAIEHHVDEVEFDLRVTKDGVIVLHHNADLVDQVGNRLVIADEDFKTLKAHKDDLATFEGAAKAINKQIPMLIEVKRHVATGPIIDAIMRLLETGWHSNDMLLGSKSYETLRQVHRAFPDIPTVVIEPWSGVRATWRARRLGTKRLSMNYHFLWRGFISSMHRRGWKLYPYPLNDPAKARRWARYGIAGVITDYPDRFEK